MQDVTPAQNEDYIDDSLKYLPESARQLYPDIPVEFLSLSESEMRRRLRPNEQQEMLRIRFWSLVGQRGLDRDESEVTLSELSAGICSVQYALSLLSTSYSFVGWLMCPVPDYETRVSALLDRGYERIKDIFDVDLKDDEGNVDVKVANLMLSTVKMLDQRKHGAYLQRIEEKSLQVHTSVEEAKKNNFLQGAKSLEEIEARIKELESSSTSTGSVEVIDVREE